MVILSYTRCMSSIYLARRLLIVSKEFFYYEERYSPPPGFNNPRYFLRFPIVLIAKCYILVEALHRTTGFLLSNKLTQLWSKQEKATENGI